MLASKQPSVIIQKSKLAATHLKKYRAKSTDPLKSMENIWLQSHHTSIHSILRDKLTRESLLKEESKPALWWSRHKTFLPAEVVDPSLFPKTNPLILSTRGIRSSSLENDLLNLDWLRCRFMFSFIFSFTLETFFSLFWTFLQDQKHAWKCWFLPVFTLKYRNIYLFASHFKDKNVIFGIKRGEI